MLVTYDPYSGTLGRFSRAEIVKMVADAGYEGLNLPVREPFVSAEDERDVDELLGLLEAHSLEVNTITFGKNECTTPGKQAEVQQWLEVVLDLADKLDAPVISIWPNLPQGVTLGAARATLAENMKAMVPAADARGKTIGLEFEKECTLDNYREGIRFINGLDPRLKLTADTYHMNNDKADLYAAAAEMRDMISDVHISGSHRGEPGSPGDAIDYGAFVRGLREIGYQGDLVLQYKLEETESLPRACAFTKGLRETLG